MELRGDDSHNYSAVQGSSPSQQVLSIFSLNILHRERPGLHEPSGDADSWDLFMFSSAWDEENWKNFMEMNWRGFVRESARKMHFIKLFLIRINSGTTVRSHHLGKLHSDWPRDLLPACDWFRVVPGPRHLCSCHNYVRAWIAYK